MKKVKRVLKVIGRGVQKTGTDVYKAAKKYKEAEPLRQKQRIDFLNYRIKEERLRAQLRKEKSKHQVKKKDNDFGFGW